MRHLLITATAAVMFIGIIAVEAAQGAELRNEAVINGPMLTLGDLFNGLEPEQTMVEVAPAPAMGHGVHLHRDWLERVARTHGLVWHPQNGPDTIEVRRPTADELAALAESLANDLGSYIEDAQSQEPMAEPVEEVVIADEMLDLVLTEPEMLEVPTVARMVRPGATITASNIIWVEIENNRRAYDYVRDLDELLGMAARRTLAPDQPIRFADLTLPILIEDGDAVTMTIHHGPMTITARGRALDDGSMNDVIRVINTDSNRTIDATVTGSGVVTVHRNPALAFAQ